MPRRASVNNYGYGGTNGHAIIEACTTDLSQSHQSNGNTKSHGLMHVSEIRDGVDHACSRAFLLSSKDAGVTRTMASNLAEYIHEKGQSKDEASVNLENIAYEGGSMLRSGVRKRQTVTGSFSTRPIRSDSK